MWLINLFLELFIKKIQTTLPFTPSLGLFKSLQMCLMFAYLLLLTIE